MDSDLKDRLLQSEIQHLGQIIQTLSYELILLQDFMKNEFGSKYESFRRKYGLQRGSNIINQMASKKNATSSVHIPKGAAYSSTIPAAPPKKDAQEDFDFELGSLLEDDISNENFTEKNRSTTGLGLTIAKSENQDQAEADDESYSESSDEHLKDPLDEEESRPGGRKKMRIWQYYDKIILKNNKFTARCHKCHNLVSSRASRMVDHRIKCKRMKKTLGESLALVKFGTIETNTTESNNDYEKSVDMGESSSNDPLGQSGDIEMRASDDDNETSSKRGGQAGRAMDMVWKYYEIVHVENLRKAKCLTCGLYVSPKAGRMRQHKIACIEASKE